MALPVETFQIKTEGLPRRCEVCHQDDLFDPLSGHCGRCSALLSVPQPLPVTITSDFFQVRTWDVAVKVVSATLAWPATVGLMIFWMTALVDFNTAYILLGVVLTVFSIYGARLVYWYFLLGEDEADTARRRWLGWATIWYNLLAILGGLVAGTVFDLGHYIPLPVSVLWLIWVSSMILYGAKLIRRESDAEFMRDIEE